MGNGQARAQARGDWDNQAAIVSPAFVGKDRVTKFWQARVTSTYPQFFSRVKREWEIFYVFCSGKSV